MRVLMVITSHDQLGNTGRKTGFWLEELAAPYYVFKEAGVDLTLASPKGGRRSIRRATSPNSGPTLPFGSRRTLLRNRNSTRLSASTASNRKTSTRSSILAVTVQCGIWPRTRIPST
jgi:putative intracellular protease/amidase